MSFAGMIDRALEKEFNESDQTEENDAGSFNNSVAGEQTNELYQLASVAFCLLVAWSSDKLGLSLELGSFAAGVMISTTDLAQHSLEQVRLHLLFAIRFDRSFQHHNVFNMDNYNGAEETPTLIDRKDNVLIISNFKSKYPVLQLDLRLISDLVVVIVSATCGGIAFACAGQLVITGYLLAGSLVGPGGLELGSFAAGVMISTTDLAQHTLEQLKVVRAVAVLGGLLQSFLLMCMCGITASVS
ncbi:hypothetical protein OSB04_010823 [Centaurea solstitialis]|uniref:Cation/H+ exchanger transmembrane domain-containing protein n=1 Tax=Centaurea solstitialis TaxID=347529 RepID=A0AA38TA02_9ASTR|nr:hypothetical protein OSB04_010823 [Centaurea solstitialis]